MKNLFGDSIYHPGASRHPSYSRRGVSALRDGKVDLEIQCQATEIAWTHVQRTGRVGVTAIGLHQGPFDNGLLQRADLGVKAAGRSGLRSPRGASRKTEHGDTTVSRARCRTLATNCRVEQLPTS